MFSIVKYFQQNHFSEKIIPLKIFSSVWHVRKNYQLHKTESGNRCQNQAMSGRLHQNPASTARFQLVSPGFSIVWLKSSRNFWIRTAIIGIQPVPPDSNN
jgi:hypothetical protein